MAVIPAAYRARDYTSSIGNMSDIDRVSSGCCICCVSSLEQATLPVVLGTCPAWSEPAVAVILQRIEQGTIPVVLGTCPALSVPEDAVIHVVSPV